MKIGIIVRILWSAGTQKFAIEQARALQEIGHDVTIIFLRKTRSGDALMELLNHVNYEVVTDRNSSKFTFLYDYITGIFMKNRKGDGRVDYNLLRQLPTFIKNKNFDYLICHDQWAGIGGYYIKKKLGIKYGIVIHERVNNFPWMKGTKRIFAYFALLWQKKIMLQADRVFTLTDAVAQTVRNLYGNKVEVFDIFPGLKNKVELDYEIKRNQIVLLSYWKEDKYPESYVPLFKEIEGYNFVIAGNWVSRQYRDKYVDLLRTEGVLEKVSFVDNMSEDDKEKVLKQSKFYVRFGLEEKGPGYGTIEAMEMGLPIICSSSLGISDYLENTAFALLVDNSDEITKIRDYISASDNKLKYDALQSEIKIIVNDYSWHRHASKLINLIEREESLF